jgi:hypothetical protein
MYIRLSTGLVAAIGLLAGLSIPARAYDAIDDMALVRKYAPVYFFHEQEIVLPSSAEVLEGRSSLIYHSADDTLHLISEPIGDIDNLGAYAYWEDIKADLGDRLAASGSASRSKQRLIKEADNEVRKIVEYLRGGTRPKVNISLDIDSLLLTEFQWLGDDKYKRRTPNELGRCWCSLDGKSPVCYVHVERDVRIARAWYETFWQEIVKHFSGLEDLDERYHVIFYVLFYPFNSFWNNHEGDWDSRIAVIVPADGSTDKPAFAIYYYHHELMFLTMASDASYGSGGFRDYLVEYGDWLEDRKKEGRGKRDHAKIGKCFAFGGTHPFVFVALGSHAAYPIPGFTMMGADVFDRIRVPVCTDLHPLDGRAFTVYSPDTSGALAGGLSQAFAGCSEAPQFDMIAADSQRPIVFITSQPWYKFPGTWGEHVRYTGWAGPTVASFTDAIVDRHGEPCFRYWSIFAKHIWSDRTRMRQVPCESPLHLYPKEDLE